VRRHNDVDEWVPGFNNWCLKYLDVIGFDDNRVESESNTRINRVIPSYLYLWMT
jgi:hypothetical protein